MPDTPHRILPAAPGWSHTVPCANNEVSLRMPAFAFEAIRSLEGYWSTVGVVEWVAQRRCERFWKQRKRYQDRWNRLNVHAWKRARGNIEQAQSEAVARCEDDAEVLHFHQAGTRSGVGTRLSFTAAA